MAKKTILEIDATPIERATSAINNEEKALAKLRQEQAEHNKAVRQIVEIERVNEKLQSQTAQSYADKQRTLKALGSVIRNYVAVTEEEHKSLNEMKEQYANLNQELKDFDATMGNFQRNVGDYNNQVAKPLTQQLKEMQRAMAEMIVAGKEGSAEYQAMAKEAGRLKDAIGDANNEVKRFANDTMALTDVVDVTKSAVSAFGLLQSATALLGIEDENLAKSIQKLQAAQTALASIQQLQATYLNKSSALYKILSTNIVTYTGASKGAAAATKALNIALKGLGIGLIVGALAYIVDHLGDIRNELVKILPFLKDETAELEKQKKLEEERNKKIKERLKLDKDLSDAMRKIRIAEGQERDVLQEDVDKAKEHLKTLEEQYNVTRNIVDLTKSRVGQEGNLDRIQREHGLWSEELKAQDEEYQNILKVVKQQKTEWANAVTELNNAEKALKAYDDQLKKTTEKKPDKTTEKAEKPKAHGASGNAYEQQYQEELSAINTYLKQKELLLSKGEISEEDYNIAVMENYDERIRLAEEYGKDTIDLEIERQKKLNELYKDAEVAQAEDITKKTEQQLEEIKSKSIALGTEIFNSISTLYNAEAEAIKKNIEDIDKQIDKAERSIDRHQDNLSNLFQMAQLSRGAERDAILQSIADEQKALKEQQAAEDKQRKEKEKLEKKQRQEEYKAKKTNLMNQLLQGLANTALGVTQALAQTPPASYVMAALTGAMGAVQTGIISAQLGKLKMADGGLLNGRRHSEGGIPVGSTGIEVEGGEYVINRRSTERYLPLLEAINNQGRRRFEDGGQMNLPTENTIADLLGMINFSPVVSVVDINRANQRLNSVQALSR